MNQNEIPKVGKTLVPVPNKKPRKLIYSDVSYDENGWANSNEFRPLDYDLVILDDGINKPKVGWAHGYEWDGPHIKKHSTFKKWKKSDELE